jgi:hypothetical protein
VKPDERGETGHKRSLSFLWQHLASGAGGGATDEEVAALWDEMVATTRLAFLALLPWLKRHNRPQESPGSTGRRRCVDRGGSGGSGSRSGGGGGGGGSRTLHHFQIIGVDILIRDASNGALRTLSTEKRYSAHLLEINCNPSLSATDDEGNPSVLDGAIKGRVTAAALALAAATARFDDAPAGSTAAVESDVGGATGTASSHDEERAFIASSFFFDDIFAPTSPHYYAAMSLMLDATALLESAAAAFDDVVPLRMDGPRAATKELLGKQGSEDALARFISRTGGWGVTSKTGEGKGWEAKDSRAPMLLSCEDFAQAAADEVARVIGCSEVVSS